MRRLLKSIFWALLITIICVVWKAFMGLVIDLDDIFRVAKQPFLLSFIAYFIGYGAGRKEKKVN